MSDTSTLKTPRPARTALGVGSSCWALVVAWSAAEPHRVGELVLLVDEGTAYVLGRGEGPSKATDARAELVRQRPGRRERTEPLRDPFLSRAQLRIRAREQGVEVESLGKRALVTRRGEAPGAVLGPGDAVEIKNRLVLLCVRRPRQMAPLRNASASNPPPFGEADEHGIVGESEAAWALRDSMAFAGPRPAHVLLIGESGTGKELVARALHASISPGATSLLTGDVSALARALPEHVDSDGEPESAVVFLDEIGDLPADLRTRLRRFVDQSARRTEGESPGRAGPVRIVATTRSMDRVEPELAARLPLRIHLTGLDARREDVPLLARHMLKRIASEDPDIGTRFFEGWDGARGEPRVAPALVRSLVEHTYTTHVRELEQILWRSLATSRGPFADLTDEVRDELAASRGGEDASPAPAREVTADEIRAAMAASNGVREQVWRRLGLANRYVLRRLMTKYGIRDESER